MSDLEGGTAESIGFLQEYENDKQFRETAFDTQLGMGRELLGAGRPDEARQCFTQAADLQRDPTPEILLLLALCDEMKGLREEAALGYREVIKTVSAEVLAIIDTQGSSVGCAELLDIAERAQKKLEELSVTDEELAEATWM